MPVKHLGGPPYLTPEEVEDGEVVTVLSEPVLVEAEQSRWGKERYRIAVELSNGEQRRWTLNTTTSDNLLKAFGEDNKAWINRKVKVRKENRTVGREVKAVLFGDAYVEPQQSLNVDKPVDLSEENRLLLRAIMDMSPEQRRALLETAKK